MKGAWTIDVEFGGLLGLLFCFVFWWSGMIDGRFL